MLRQKVLVDVLGQANSGGIVATMLFNEDGQLLAFNGSDQARQSADVSAALLSNIWKSFDKRGRKDDLQEIIISGTEGMLFCMKVANMLLLSKTTLDVQLGLVRLKLRKMAKYLEEPLNIIWKTSQEQSL